MAVFPIISLSPGDRVGVRGLILPYPLILTFSLREEEHIVWIFRVSMGLEL
jgi:hypothetical protein